VINPADTKLYSTHTLLQ